MTKSFHSENCVSTMCISVGIYVDEKLIFDYHNKEEMSKAM